MTSMTTDTVKIPATGSYRIDPAHSTISFATRHLFGLAPVHGTFRLRDGHIVVADPLAGSSARATISATSFDTGVAARDATIRSATYLDVANHPDIGFASTGLELVEDRWVLHGSLTVRGRTRPVDVHLEDLRPDGHRLRLRAVGRVDRYEFGITAGRGITGRRLTLRLDLAADRG